MSDVVRKAALYCRVSHTKQRDVGTGLVSQELRCRAYAAPQGYEFDAVYTDDVKRFAREMAAANGGDHE